MKGKNRVFVEIPASCCGITIQCDCEVETERELQSEKVRYQDQNRPSAEGTTEPGFSGICCTPMIIHIPCTGTVGDQKQYACC